MFSCFVWTHGLWRLCWSFVKERRDEKKEKREMEGRENLNFFMFYQWHLAAHPAPPSMFLPFSIENRCSSIPDYFYPTFHYHNKTHAWKKDKLKETARPKTGICEAYFHLSFLSSILLCCSFLVAQKNGKRHAFSFSRCLIMVLFRLCSFVWGRPRAAHKHSGAAGGLPGLASSLRQNNQPLQRTLLPSVAWTLHALISVAKAPCQD